MKKSRKTALVAGSTILIMALVAVFIFGYIHSNLVVSGNSMATVDNLKSGKLLFGLEVLGWHIILLFDVIVAWALYAFFKEENRKMAFIIAGLRIIYAAILGVAIVNLIYVLKILNGNIEVGQGITPQQIMSFIESFETIWSFGLIIFGFHLLFLGVQVLKLKTIHHFWGVALILAALAYIGIHGSGFLFPGFESRIRTVEMVLSLPMAFGEIGFGFWLLIWGGKPKILFRKKEQDIVVNQSY